MNVDVYNKTCEKKNSKDFHILSWKPLVRIPNLRREWVLLTDLNFGPSNWFLFLISTLLQIEMFLKVLYTIKSCCRLLTKVFISINFKSDYLALYLPFKPKIMAWSWQVLPGALRRCEGPDRIREYPEWHKFSGKCCGFVNVKRLLGEVRVFRSKCRQLLIGWQVLYLK